MWLIVLSICVGLSLIMSLMLCLCWRQKQPKSEWPGVEGMVTQKNPDENVNHLPSVTPVVSNGGGSGDVADSAKRNTNSRRSLPDIPSDSVAVNWEPSGDNSSEHYATVGQYSGGAKRQTLSNGIEPRPSASQGEDAFSPYEKVKYDKIKSKEHPYAQVSSGRTLEENIDDRTILLRPEVSCEPNPPPRSRRSSSSHSSHGVDIPAASAVAGGIAASPDLPYMTPPVNQSNFSGDSQDSSKGYTSISVREPLANIMAQTKLQQKKRRDLDPHYSTVSDDSDLDDVYTTIQDPNQIYTSESETYAQIPSKPMSVEAEVNVPKEEPKKEEIQSTSHTRQDSSSSSIANLGSPKPEKRQANSPLPPPPNTEINIEDLYAKVHKTKKEDTSLKVETCSNEEVKNHNYETLNKKTRKPNDPGYEQIKYEEPRYASIHGPDSITSSEPCYEVLNQESTYEELQRRLSDCTGYSRIKRKNSKDSNYESVPSDKDPNYESVREMEPYEPSSDNDLSGYERVRHNDSSETTSGDKSEEPPYEQLSNSTDSEVPGYERINAGTTSSCLEEDAIFEV